MCWNFVPGAEAGPFHDDLVDAAVAGRRDRDLAGPRLGVGKEVGHGLVGRGRVDREHAGRVGERGDRRKVALDVVGQLLEQRRVDGDLAERRDEEGVAVGRRLGDGRHPDEAVAAGPVLDDHLLAPRFRELLPDDARGDVGDPARRERDHEADRLGGPGLRGGGGEGGEEGAGDEADEGHAVAPSVDPPAHVVLPEKVTAQTLPYRGRRGQGIRCRGS